VSNERPTLAIVPIHLRDAEDLEVTLRCLVSLRMSAPEVALLVVDDASPDGPRVADLKVALDELGGELIELDERVGATAAINVGLAGALEYGFDALVVDRSIEFRVTGWFEQLQGRVDGMGRPAAVVGARLLDGRGLLWHAGIYHSMLRLAWFNRLQYGPAELPEALLPTRCPVSFELALIRHETLATVGTLDERLDHLAAVDYCLQVFQSGLEVIYEPTACAVQLQPGRDLQGVEPVATQAARDRLMLEKWPTPDLTSWMPDPL
jgi:GT2 family glycosyltransferase